MAQTIYSVGRKWLFDIELKLLSLHSFLKPKQLPQSQITLVSSPGFAPCHRYLSLHFTEGPEISGEGRSQRRAFTIKTSFFLGITASHPHPLVITRIHGVTVWTTSIDFAHVPMGPLTLHGALQVMADNGK